MTKHTNTVRLIELLPDLALDKLRSISRRKPRLAEQRQAALIDMIVASFSGSARAHNRKPTRVTFGCFELRRRLHAQNSRRSHALLAPFFDFAIERKGFYKGTTKSYALKAHVLAACNRWAAESGPARIPDITREDALDAVEVAQAQGNLKAAAGLKLAADHITEDGYPNVVVGQQSNGRLIPDASSPHLVTMPREQRNLLLQQGDDDEQWWDYDFNSSHLRIFVDLCRHYGLPHTRVQGYLDHKALSGAAWAKLIGHDTPDDFKKIVLSWLNGAALSTSPKQTCGRLLGPERAKQFLALKAVSEMHREIQSAMEQIVRRLGNKKNAVGLALPEGAPFKKQCSHILTGYEQFALRVVCSGLPQGSLITTIYDGWTSRVALSDEQLRDLEEQVRLASRREFNIPLHIDIRGKPFRDAAYHGFSKEDT